MDGLFVRGGTVVRRDAPDETLDLLLLRERGDLVFGTVPVPGQYAVTDTLDASGLYIHTTNPFETTVRTTPIHNRHNLAIAMYVLRTGHSPGTPAKWLVGPSDWRRVEPAENHPPGPVDRRVGCYVVERGAWSDPDFRFDEDRTLWFPDSLWLHWQYHWPAGPPKYLVATDIQGRVRGPRIARYAWAGPADDSLRVVFGTGFVATIFRGAQAGDDYVGEIAVDSDTGRLARAPTRLRRTPCPRDPEETGPASGGG
ncbi:MAG: hypothetical protein P8099_04800 [Gemmatimonadota bacterium]